ncbi:sigma-70 family RNA polymerase sigma factor [Nocardioides nanhaiensis]|uniref:SigE family RNA polymerase sigma factor n=1 Tax=Nocardioides nanhaiensis TaxID=1476871 RepID=A0ABP8W1W6_9ACTN
MDTTPARPATHPGFEEFATAQQRRLLGLAHALTGNPHDAWDLTQETLARVAARWRRIDDAGAYARTTMVRLNTDTWRRWRRERPSADPAGVEAGREPGYEPRLVGEVDAWLLEGLATLSADQRTALALRYVEDLDTRSIAHRMGVPEGTARSNLTRGTARLREHARAAGALHQNSEETR